MLAGMGIEPLAREDVRPLWSPGLVADVAGRSYWSPVALGIGDPVPGMSVMMADGVIMSPSAGCVVVAQPYRPAVTRAVAATSAIGFLRMVFLPRVVPL